MILRTIAITSGTVLLLAAVLYGRSADSTEPVENLGTLTCTASPGDKDLLGPEVRLSCAYEPTEGAKASFAGTIKRIDGQAQSDGKVVLVWAVLGPKADDTAAQLEGRYQGASTEGGRPNETGLVGGNGGHITLRPLTVDPGVGVGENAALTVMELQLSAMKA